MFCLVPTTHTRPDEKPKTHLIYFIFFFFQQSPSDTRSSKHGSTRHRTSINGLQS